MTNEQVRNSAQSLYEDLWHEQIEVLWDDREGVSAGEKFADADLLGIPLRLVVSQRTLQEGSIEWKGREELTSRLILLEDIQASIRLFLSN
jgi:prolyl-tRNA synthetase